jgi:hypothetical protein
MYIYFEFSLLLINQHGQQRLCVLSKCLLKVNVRTCVVHKANATFTLGHLWSESSFFFFFLTLCIPHVSLSLTLNAFLSPQLFKQFSRSLTLYQIHLTNFNSTLLQMKILLSYFSLYVYWLSKK